MLLAALVGCGGQPSAPDSAQSAVRRLLEHRATAVLHRDLSGFLTTEAPTGQPQADELATGREEFDNLAEVPLAAWAYRVTGFHRSGDRATVDADLRYRLTGYDRAPITAGRTLTLVRSAGRWYVTSDEPAKKSAVQLWDQGAVEVVRGAHSLVLGVGRTDAELKRYASLADRAVPAVSEAWGTDWARKVVVVVPESLAGMAGLLGAQASAYRGIAAVTTGEVGGAGKAPADRVVVNPEAYGVLGDFGRQVVLTHETTHVATRTHTTPATPLWLSEGYADWVGYRGSGRGAAQIAPELDTAMSQGDVPAALPADGDFAFGSDAGKLARAYEGGWMACRMIADHWGEVRLDEFYRAVGEHDTRPGAVAAALKSVLDTTPAAFTARWQAYLRAQLG
ncbi:hypothetical protein OK074_6020 [Actinobacteria bacterium OK074]|nr:hypothetical protein OK074_6020 [Actinobacteria bacterium OK074]